jgi:hypothetical protein
MLDCLILGDSIAVGTHMVKQECVSYSTGGYNTWQWNKKYPNDLNAEVVVISLGTNDHKGVNTLRELKLMRARVKAQRVYWIMPPCNNSFCKPEVNVWVKQVAEDNGDFIITTKRLQKDNIHPSWAGYKEISEQVK